MFLTRLSTSVVVVVTVAAGGCSNSTENCIALPNLPVAYFPAITVGVSDSLTGKPLADSATGNFRSVGPGDSLRHGWNQPDSIIFGDAVPGTYAVMVQRPGYIPWYRYDVVIASGNCGIAVPANLTARLQPLP